MTHNHPVRTNERQEWVAVSDLLSRAKSDRLALFAIVRYHTGYIEESSEERFNYTITKEQLYLFT